MAVVSHGRNQRPTGMPAGRSARADADLRACWSGSRSISSLLSPGADGPELAETSVSFFPSRRQPGRRTESRLEDPGEGPVATKKSFNPGPNVLICTTGTNDLASRGHCRASNIHSSHRGGRNAQSVRIPLQGPCSSPPGLCSDQQPTRGRVPPRQ